MPGAPELGGPWAPAALAALRARGPIADLPDGSGRLVVAHRQAVAVMRADDVFTVDDPRFSTARVVGASMLSLDGDGHRRHRTPFAAPFRPSRIERRFAIETEQLCEGLLDAAARPGRQVELRAALAGPLSTSVVTSALGLPGGDAGVVLGWYRDIVAAVGELSVGGTPSPAANTAVRALDAHVRGALGAPGSVLAAAVDELSVTDIVANAAVMLFGGIETTEGMIANALAHVLGDPAIASRLRADPALVSAAVEESLRLEPAAAAVDRYATSGARIGNTAIAAGELVRVSLLAANRDPDVFPDPDRFDPTRPNLRDQLAFARGPHTCLAMDLARLETRVAVRAVLRRPGLRLLEASPPTGLIFRKPDRVLVEFD